MLFPYKMRAAATCARQPAVLFSVAGSEIQVLHNQSLNAVVAVFIDVVDQILEHFIDGCKQLVLPRSDRDRILVDGSLVLFRRLAAIVERQAGKPVVVGDQRLCASSRNRSRASAYRSFPRPQAARSRAARFWWSQG